MIEACELTHLEIVLNKYGSPLLSWQSAWVVLDATIATQILSPNIEDCKLG